MAPVRCFIGLPLEPAVARALRERVEDVLDPGDWRLHPEEDLHLTLCFLGEVHAERIEPLADALRVALGEGSARELAPKLAPQLLPRLLLQGTGCFGDPSAPRVLWAAVRGGAAELAHLTRLRAACARAVSACGLAWDHDGTFTPHVTVARPRGRAALPERFAALELELAWHPIRVGLFASLPGQRPHYPVLASFPRSPEGP